MIALSGADAFRGNGGGGRGGGNVGVASKGAGPTEPEKRCRKHRRRPRAMLEARSPHAEALPEDAPARCFFYYRTSYECLPGSLQNRLCYHSTIE